MDHPLRRLFARGARPIHADVTARNPNPEESDYKFAAGPFDRNGGSYGRDLGGLLSAIGGGQMGTLEQT